MRSFLIVLSVAALISSYQATKATKEVCRSAVYHVQNLNQVSLPVTG